MSGKVAGKAATTGTVVTEKVTSLASGNDLHACTPPLGHGREMPRSGPRSNRIDEKIPHLGESI